MFLRLVSVIEQYWFKENGLVIILNGNIQFDVMEYILHSARDPSNPDFEGA